jgi:hypothetical protein
MIIAEPALPDHYGTGDIEGTEDPCSSIGVLNKA